LNIDFPKLEFGTSISGIQYIINCFKYQEFPSPFVEHQPACLPEVREKVYVAHQLPQNHGTPSAYFV
jgi:hypothetical protein